MGARRTASLPTYLRHTSAGLRGADGSDHPRCQSHGAAIGRLRGHPVDTWLKIGHCLGKKKHLATHRDWAGNEHAGDSALHRALAFWTRVHGVLSLELAGHFVGMAFDPALLYAAEVDAAITENAEQGRGRPAPAR
ncbi:TetR-like C-terminal domain-containing protein [Fodinicola feengrottensis]|uniref:TetR-like C-terminal domain-containing protein n=1 Tax=Fodinicola feengrottensis TaxID=435914 RepID=UPI0036F393FA